MEAEERFDENKDTTESINNDNKVEEASQKDNNSEQLEKQAIDVTETGTFCCQIVTFLLYCSYS